MRQAKFGMAVVPPINHMPKDIKGYESMVKVFTEALMKKMSHDYRLYGRKKDCMWANDMIKKERAMFKDCIEQTISFLKHISALKPLKKPLAKIELWKDAVKMEPFYEGVNVSLKTMLIEYHCPSMAKEIHKGAVYDHYTLTEIGEAVLYTMEYFAKEKYFNTVKQVLHTTQVKRWVDDWADYVSKNKDRLKKEDQAREKYMDKQRADLDKMKGDICWLFYG